MNFKNTIIIMTSNIGSDIIYENFKKNSIFDKKKFLEIKEKVFKVLHQNMRPEFLNRIDEIIMFTPLSLSEIKEIVNLQLNIIKNILEKNGISIEFSENAIKYISKIAYQPQFGARPIKRMLQKNILNELSKQILKNKISKNITVDLIENQLVFY